MKAVVILLAALTLTATAQQAPKGKGQRRPALPEDVERRTVSIFSDATRMAGHLYLPKNRKPEDKLPAVVLCAGTGGTKEQTGTRLGPILAQHGYIALAFDYRGWGESDSKLMSVERQPKVEAGQEITIKVKPLRGQMDYADQTEDIRAAVSYIIGEPGVDAARIALWGTSYGGGLVVWAAGNDPRVKCLAAQVPGMGGTPGPAALKAAYDLATKQARGETEPAPIETGKLTGLLARYTAMRRNPVKGLGYNALEAAAKITAPSLFVIAEKEEFGGNPAVETAHKDLVKRGVPSEIHMLKNATHYSVYAEAFDEATRVEIQWFDKHLRSSAAPSPKSPEK